MADPFVKWPPDDVDLGWLAGILEGEGSFYQAKGVPHISLGMNDEDVVARAANLMGVAYHPFVYKQGKTRYQFEIGSRSRAGRIMSTLFWLMGERRKKQIEKALEFPKE